MNKTKFKLPIVENPDPMEEFYNEDFINYKHETLGYDNEYQRNHVLNVIINFRKDITEITMKQFDEDIQNLDKDPLIELRSQLKALKIEFENELAVRYMEGDTKTPYSEPEFRNYMYLNYLVEKQLNLLNDFILSKFL